MIAITDCEEHPIGVPRALLEMCLYLLTNEDDQPAFDRIGIGLKDETELTVAQLRLHLNGA